MEWISVEDKLPECITPVFSYAENKPEGFRYGVWHKTPNLMDEFFSWNTCGEITHWSMPSPPKSV